MVNVADSLVQENYDVKQQLGDLPIVTQSLQRFESNITPQHHSSIVKDVSLNNSFIIGKSGFNGRDTYKLISDSTTELYAVLPQNNIFMEDFGNDLYVNLLESTGTLGDLNYSMVNGSVLESQVIAKLREPIKKIKFLSNNDLSIGESDGLKLPFTLGVDVFGESGNSTIYVSNDSGTTWFEVDSDGTYSFSSYTDIDELKYKVIASEAISITNPIRIQVNI